MTTQDLTPVVNVNALLTENAALAVKMSPTRVLASALVADFGALAMTLQRCRERLDRIANERQAYALEYLTQCEDKFAAVITEESPERQALLLDELKGLLTGLASYVPSQAVITKADGTKRAVEPEERERWKLEKRAVRAAGSLPPVHRSQSVSEKLLALAEARERREQEKVNKATVDSADATAGKGERKPKARKPKARKPKSEAVTDSTESAPDAPDAPSAD